MAARAVMAPVARLIRCTYSDSEHVTFSGEGELGTGSEEEEDDLVGRWLGTGRMGSVIKSVKRP